MRSFAVLLTFCLSSGLTTVFANEEVSSEAVDRTAQAPLKSDALDGLFVIELEKSDTQSFQDLLSRAMSIEMVRLSGTSKVLNNPESKFFLDNPKLWLKTYGFKPRMVEGVKVGENIYFEFDEQRLYNQFQKTNLQVWPLNKRPKTFVVASQTLGGAETKLTNPVLDYRNDIDFRGFAENLYLPISVPNEDADWILPDSELDVQILTEVLQRQHADYLLNVDIQESADGQSQLIWTLYNNVLDTIDTQTQTLDANQLPKQAIDTVFQQLFERYSEPYLESANVLGEFTVEVAGLKQFTDFSKLETFLETQKPQFRQVKLLSNGAGKAVFEVEYQGEYTAAIDRIQQFQNLNVVDNNALIGLVRTQWQDAK